MITNSGQVTVGKGQLGQAIQITFAQVRSFLSFTNPWFPWLKCETWLALFDDPLRSYPVFASIACYRYHAIHYDVLTPLNSYLT